MTLLDHRPYLKRAKTVHILTNVWNGFPFFHSIFEHILTCLIIFSLCLTCLISTNNDAFCCRAIKSNRNQNQSLKWYQDFPQNVIVLLDRFEMNARRILNCYSIVILENEDCVNKINSSFESPVSTKKPIAFLWESCKRSSVFNRSCRFIWNVQVPS